MIDGGVVEGARNARSVLALPAAGTHAVAPAHHAGDGQADDRLVRAPDDHRTRRDGLRRRQSRRRRPRARARIRQSRSGSASPDRCMLLPGLVVFVVALAITVIGVLLIPFAIVAYVIAAAGLVTLGFLAVARLTGGGLHVRPRHDIAARRAPASPLHGARRVSGVVAGGGALHVESGRRLESCARSRSRSPGSRRPSGWVRRSRRAPARVRPGNAKGNACRPTS